MKKVLAITVILAVAMVGLAKTELSFWYAWEGTKGRPFWHWWRNQRRARTR